MTNYQENNPKRKVLVAAKENVKYLENQIANSCEHLKRDWSLLKNESKNWTRLEITQIVYNIEKQVEYLGICKAKLESYQLLLTECHSLLRLRNLQLEKLRSMGIHNFPTLTEEETEAKLQELQNYLIKNKGM